MTVQESIEKKISEALFPHYLDVQNESTRHRGPADAETHFRLVTVSKEFENKKPLERHRLVFALLSDELKRGVHALSLQLFTPDEWAREAKVKSSPPCANKDDVSK